MVYGSVEPYTYTRNMDTFRLQYIDRQQVNIYPSFDTTCRTISKQPSPFFKKITEGKF